ncbi:MAG: cation diffusion facilitator family transporter [Planctomycetia bacterium]|nr:cation diffusion facilitator family transporter [Planctomycetia bacterium]
MKVKVKMSSGAGHKSVCGEPNATTFGLHEGRNPSTAAGHGPASADELALWNVQKSRAISQVTWLGFIINVALSAIKLLAGIFSHSQVLIADAVHSLSDLATDLAIIIGVKFWEKPADRDHPHGHAKLETLVTVFIGAVLALVGFGLVWSAITTLTEILNGKTFPLPGRFALIAALFSIFLKEVLYRVTMRVGTKYGSTSVLANAWHHRSDALSSIPAAVAVLGCLLFGDHYLFLDPVGTILVSCMIIYAAMKILLPALSTLMDRGLEQETVHRIQTEIESDDHVYSVHKVRTRPLGSGWYAVELHIQVDPEMTVLFAHELSHRIQSQLCHDYENIVDVSVHVEPYRPLLKEPERTTTCSE